MDKKHFYDHDAIIHGNCCRCGAPLKENEGLFLCNKCKAADQEYYKKRKENKNVSD